MMEVAPGEGDRQGRPTAGRGQAPDQIYTLCKGVLCSIDDL